MLQLSNRLRITGKAASAATHNFPFRANGFALAYRANSGKFIRHTISRPVSDKRLYNLRNNITCTLQDNMIANTNIFAQNFIFIMQGGIRYHHAANIDRPQSGNRGKCACASHLDINIFDNGAGFFCREFMRNRPTWCTANLTKPALIAMIINLINNTINIIIKASARITYFMIGLK